MLTLTSGDHRFLSTKVTCSFGFLGPERVPPDDNGHQFLELGCLSKKVRYQIVRVSLASCPTLASVASDLGLSPRTLQRHLEKEDNSFSDILDELRSGAGRPMRTSLY